MMKILVSIFFVFALSATYAQTIKVELLPNGYYQKDTLGKKIIPSVKGKKYKISPVNLSSKYFASSMNDTIIYITLDQVTITPELASWTMNLAKSQNRKRFKEHYKDAFKKYGRFGPLVEMHEIAVGMTKDMVFDSLGKPTESSDTKARYYTSDLWVYRKSDTQSTYVHFYNGTVSSIQNVNL